MHTLHLDEEQAQMVVEAMESGIRFLDFRLNRIDPEGILANSQKLQQSKLAQIKHQMALGPVSTWRDLSPDDKKQFQQFCQLLTGTKSVPMQAAAYDQIVNFCTVNRHQTAPLLLLAEDPA